MDGGIRVLYVGGDCASAPAVVPRLERADERFAVETAPDARAAADRLDDADCVVSDVEVPGSDGVEFLATVREEHPDLPVVLFTDAGREAVSAAVSAGVTEYLPRDPDADQSGALADLIADAVEQNPSGRSAADRRETSALLEALFEHSPDMINVHDTEGSIIEPNPTLCGQTGYDADELAGMKVWDIDRTVDAETAGAMWDEMAVGDRRRVEGVYERADGSTFPVEVHIRRLDLEGEDRFVAISRDVTERRERERALEAERAFIDQTLDTLDDLFYVVGTDGRLRRWNDRLLEVAGYDESTVDGMAVTEFFPPDERDRIADAVEETLTTGRTTVEADLLTADGDRVPYEFTGARLDDADGDLDGLVGIGRDVSERKRREEALRAKNERLEEFASVVSHDLRNPLQVAAASVSLAREERDDDRLADAAAALDRMDALIDDLLTLAREGRRVDEVETVDLGAVVRGCWANVATDDATLVVDAEGTVRADPTRLQQLLENLLQNAVEHGSTSPDSQARQDAVEHGSTSPRSSSTPEDAVEHGSTSPDSQARQEAPTVTVGDLPDGFYVEDDGPGIPTEEREAVFDSGYTTDEDGTGFGLSIVQEIAQAHGWDVTVAESETGGARFEITGVDRA